MLALRILTAALAVTLAGGCASSGGPNPVACAIGSQILAATGGGLAGNDLKSGENNGAIAVGVLGGAVIGALVGYGVCKWAQKRNEEKRKRARAHPTPIESAGLATEPIALAN
jgi:membrane protein DedA with SNARE-associated domain